MGKLQNLERKLKKGKLMVEICFKCAKTNCGYIPKNGECEHFEEASWAKYLNVNLSEIGRGALKRVVFKKKIEII